MLEIVDTDPNEPARILIYGEGGLGKSTFGARADKPVIVAVEEGASRLTDKNGAPVKMIKGITSFKEVIDATKMLINDVHDFKTVVFDSATEIERLAHRQIIGSSGKSIVTVNKGYGAGHAESDAMHTELLSLIKELRAKRNVNIIITGHSQIRPAKDPSASEEYDQFEPKLAKGVSGIWKEFVDANIFIRILTIVKTSDESKARAVTDGSRIAMTTQTPSCIAKNRFGLPSQMDFTLNFWEDLRPYINKGVQPITVDQLKSELGDLYLMLTDEVLKEKVATSITDAGNDTERLNQILSRLKELTKGKG